MDNDRRQFGHLQEIRSRREEAELRPALAKRVAAYGLAAAGAGLGIMVGSQPAEAKIVYTPAKIVFESRAVIDIDNVEFVVTQIKEDYFGYTFILKVQGGGVLASSRFPGWAGRLSLGAKIGASGHFYRNPQMAEAATYNCCPTHSGPWDPYGPLGPSSGFLGLKFLVDGQSHYGWAEVSIVSDPQGYPHLAGFRGVVRGFAYNTVPNQAILAGQTSDGDFIGEMPPQPAALGLLALGAPALDIWRPGERGLAAEAQ
jgi:hypothetical protein